MGFLDWLRGRRPEPEPEVPAPPPAPTGADIAAACDRIDASVATGVPAAVRTRVERITRTIRETLPRMGDAGLDSADTYVITATATSYVPETLDAYLRLPRDWADTRPIERGRTALMLLIDQLDLLGATMDKIFDAVCSADATALIANGRFLEARFGKQAQGGDLSVAAPVAAPANPLDLEAR